jgi:hypothetical protein
MDAKYAVNLSHRSQEAARGPLVPVTGKNPARIEDLHFQKYWNASFNSQARTGAGLPSSWAMTFLRAHQCTRLPMHNNDRRICLAAFLRLARGRYSLSGASDQRPIVPMHCTIHECASETAQKPSAAIRAEESLEKWPAILPDIDLRSTTGNSD